MIYEGDKINVFERAKRAARILVKSHIPSNWSYQINSESRYSHAASKRQLFWVIMFKYEGVDSPELNLYWHPCTNPSYLDDFYFNSNGFGNKLDKLQVITKDIPELKKCVSVIVESLNPKNI